MHARRHRVQEERGSVLTLVAVCLPVLVLFATLVVDIGNWFEHKRHLQLQADAGALAGAGFFNECIAPSPTADADITAAAQKYADDPALGGTRYNPQVGTSNQLLYRYNSKTYAFGGPPPDDTIASTPCTAKMLDLKLTQRNLRWLLAPSRFVPAINARARVEAKTVETQVGSLPFAIPNFEPHYATATFVNEATGVPLTCGAGPCLATLTKNDSISPLNGLDIWDNSLAPLSVTIPSGVVKVGVRIKLNEGNDAAADCGAVLVSCYLPTTLIRGWTATATGCASGSNCPAARDVRLATGTCTPDAYFSAAVCTFGVEADINFTDHPIAGATVTAHAGGKNRTLVAPSSGTIWTTTLSDIDSAASGGEDVTIDWDWKQTTGTWRGLTCKNGGSNPCQDSGNFGFVHRSFVADPTLTGAILLTQVGESGVTLSGANSFQQGTAHPLVVRVGLTSVSNATAANDPTVLLRVASPSGSHNQAIDCDVGRNLEDEIATGCQTPYQVNPTLTCPDPTSNPADCAPIETGDKVGPVKKGMDRHFAPGDVCSPNNWYSSDPTKLPVILPGDPRVVPLIVTTYNSFGGSGSGEVPVVHFATFYVTGWYGQNSVDCSAVNAPPPPGSRSNSADVWGHFIKFIDLPGGSSGETQCDFDPSAIGNCIAVMTR
jgi:Flp pilus assembly protein TadG